ncbi:hypothetical protein Zm00014a_044002 [Zea mays]|uniref:Chaperone DnaJ-domain superfamily protein n=1 Tax=Zea mays TaxID=4577 RepID=A0A3L6E7Q6_MAIZE|nr:hypothetical protein Zm00014a_044002 [Zea mays]
MNSIKSAIFSGHRSHPHVGAAAVPQQQLGSTASFHSTPVLQRKHKTQWHNVNTERTNTIYLMLEQRFNYYTRRRRNRETKRSMLRNMSEYAESLFQRNSKRARSQKSRNWSFETDEEDGVSAPSEVSLARQALGLSTSGPLKLEDVKSAYRACALRWHPDRHNGSSKVSLYIQKFKSLSFTLQN